MVVGHLCHNRRCFRYDHLKVMTQSENLLMSRHNLGQNDKRGELNPAAKLTDVQVAEIRSATGTNVELAKRYGVSDVRISQIRRGR